MDKIINDCSLRVATANGTGSQSSNTILYRSLFRMGIGVCGKNMFPSNIQGLPTWFQIRVSKEGYQCLRERDNIAVLMNPVTAKKDFEEMGPNTTIIYNSNLITPDQDMIKDGMHLYALPVEELSKKISNPKLVRLLKNLFYVGALAHLYGIEVDVIEEVIKDMFSSKPKAIDVNIQAFHIGFEYSKENFEKKDNWYFERSNCNDGKIIMEGNAAAGLGAVYGGCHVLAWYPITPSSSLAESMIGYMKKYRHGKDGEANYAIVQAEDELASAGMVMGAGWAGARSMTTTSGAGISLMSEFIGLGYYAEIPSVFANVQRVGPSTGLPTRTQQCDIMFTANCSQGDTKHPMLFPSSINECYSMMMECFELAEKFQTPVFFMTDLDLGMNNWVNDEIKYQKPKYDRGKVLTAEQLEKMEDWGRYKDVDGDGVGYRTLPGCSNPKGSYFTRGSGHNEYAKYSESPVDYTNNVDRLLKKWETIKTAIPKPVINGDTKSKVGILGFGTSDPAIVEALDRMDAHDSIRYCRLKGYPFTKEVEDFVTSCDRIFVVEQNRDKQMRQLLEIDIPGNQQKFRSINYYGGFPLSSDFVERELKKGLEE